VEEEDRGKKIMMVGSEEAEGGEDGKAVKGGKVGRQGALVEGGPEEGGWQVVEDVALGQVLEEREEGDDGVGRVGCGVGQDAVDVTHHRGPLGGPGGVGGDRDPRQEAGSPGKSHGEEVLVVVFDEEPAIRGGDADGLQEGEINTVLLELEGHRGRVQVVQSELAEAGVEVGDTGGMGAMDCSDKDAVIYISDASYLNEGGDEARCVEGLESRSKKMRSLRSRRWTRT